MKPDEAKAALIDKTVEHAHAKLPEDQAARLEALIRIYYGAVAPEDLLERSAADLYGAALAQLQLRRTARPGRGQGPRLHAAARGARLDLGAHGRRDRQRRHAVPRRLGEHGAQPARKRRPPHHPPGRPRAPRRDGAAPRRPAVRHAGRGRAARVVPPRRGRARDGAGAPRAPARGAGARARGCPGGGRGLAGHGRAGPRGHRRRRARPALDRPGGARREQGAPRVDRRQPLHVPRLPRVRPRLGERRARAAAGARHGARHPAQRRRRGGRRRREARAGGRRARARQGPARPHEGQLARDRPPAVLPGLRRREALRRVGRGRGRAALPRSLHVDRVQREPSRHPAPAPQGPQGPGALGPPAREPRRQGAPRGARVSPARRALPDLRRRSLRHRHGHRPARRTAAGQALRPQGHLRALPLVPRLRAARALQHAGAGEDRGHPPGGVRGRQRRLHRAPLRVGAGAHALRHLHAPGGDRSSTTSRRSRRGSSRRRARGSTTSATRSSSTSARSGARSCSRSIAMRSRRPTATTSRRRPRCSTSSAWSASTPRATSP